MKDKWTSEGAIRDDQSVRLSRETKRKISPSKATLGAQDACSNIDLEGLKNLRGLRLEGLSPMLTKNGLRDAKLEQANLVTKHSLHALVKGKKALARSRVMTNEIRSRVESSNHQAANKLFLFTSPPNHAIINGRTEQVGLVKPQFTQSEGANMGKHCTGNGGGELGGSACQTSCIPELGLGLDQFQDEESMDNDSAPCVEGSVWSVVGVSTGGAKFEGASMFGLVSHTQNFRNPDESFEATGMDLEGGGKASSSC